MFIAVDKVQEWLREARKSKAELQIKEATKIISRKPCRGVRLLGTEVIKDGRSSSNFKCMMPNSR